MHVDVAWLVTQSDTLKVGERIRYTLYAIGGVCTVRFHGVLPSENISKCQPWHNWYLVANLQISMRFEMGPFISPLFRDCYNYLKALLSLPECAT
jgi:hypothetical protein